MLRPSEAADRLTLAPFSTGDNGRGSLYNNMIGDAGAAALAAGLRANSRLTGLG